MLTNIQRRLPHWRGKSMRVLSVAAVLGLSLVQPVLAQSMIGSGDADVRSALLVAQADLAQNLVRLNAIIAYQEGLLAGIQSDGALLGARPDPGAVCGEVYLGICAYFPVTFSNKDP